MPTQKKARAARKAAPANSRSRAPVNGEDPMSKDLTQYITTKQAAELMGVDQTHINRLLIEKRLKGFKWGHDWMIFKPSIEKYNETKSTKGRPRSHEPQLQEAS